jgi:TPR repeat protein
MRSTVLLVLLPAVLAGNVELDIRSRALEMGDSDAMVQLAAYILFPEAYGGQGWVSNNVNLSGLSALGLLNQALAKSPNHKDALLLLALLEDSGMKSALDGRSLPSAVPIADPHKFQTLMQRAADAGSLEARFAMGVRQSTETRTCENAVDHFQFVIAKALPKDHEHHNYVPAVRLSEIWEDQSSTPLALGEGKQEIEYFKKQASDGDKDAAFHMGMISLHGDRIGGHEKNFTLAVEYLEQALALGNDKAHVDLCMTHMSGYGMKANVEKGRGHCLEAIQKGLPNGHNQ